MKYRIFILFLFAAFPYLIFAENVDLKSTFEHANQLYGSKNYSGALNEYQKLIENGVESAEVYYNIANCYFRLRKTAESIYYYEKARKLKPNDEDIKFNQNVAQLRVIDKFETVPKFFLRQWYEDAINNYSSTFWAVLAVAAVWLAAVFMSAFLFVWNLALKKSMFAASLILLLVFVISLIFTFERSKFENQRNEAVIFTPSVYVKSSPDDEGTDLFILHEGTKVSIMDGLGDWLKIKLPNGNIGWITIDDLKII